jgi:hypothetical protein
LNKAIIQKHIQVHIQEQDKHKIALDKLNVKEYNGPFKG